VRLALVDQPWFIVTLIVCIGSALWLAMCVAVVVIICYRRRRKLLTGNKYGDGLKPGKATNSLRSIAISQSIIRASELHFFVIFV